ncbi:T9SS type A sorting domain-containing protein [Nonlabens agnitus]|uniref:Secretion system C-terminal sorting domain-containing protein n=1 Tax=Nonlabens agnitus TaxID=870484 RepID=A0A2S9WWW3_9FLAO|nr:T9SS type A sorting domain-containing protein [Nonlabens agnitus]PRP67954.1 hypothetical protein BST86_13060 [Nonlabens agnitus]
MTNVPVYDLDLRTADNTVLATTHGRGLFTGKFTADTASITAPLDENQLKVFPTQATSEIFISTKLNYNNADVTIFNLNGQQVYQQKKSLSSSRQRIDVSGLSTGLYLLKVHGNGIDQTVKFVKE